MILCDEQTFSKRPRLRANRLYAPRSRWPCLKSSSSLRVGLRVYSRREVRTGCKAGLHRLRGTTVQGVEQYYRMHGEAGISRSQNRGSFASGRAGSLCTRLTRVPPIAKDRRRESWSLAGLHNHLEDYFFSSVISFFSTFTSPFFFFFFIVVFFLILVPSALVSDFVCSFIVSAAKTEPTKATPIKTAKIAERIFLTRITSF